MTAEFTNPVTEAQGFIADNLLDDESRRAAEPFEPWFELDRAARIIRALLAERDRRAIDHAGLRQALWDIYAILGFDTDGDPTPAAVGHLADVVVGAAREFRSDYDDLLDELTEHPPTTSPKDPA